MAQVDQRAREIRVVVADDHTYYRSGLVGLLREHGVDVVADVPNGEAAIRAFHTHAPDVVVMDVSMPGVTGVDATRRLVDDFPDARVLMLSVSQEDEDVLTALLAGARGFVLKDGPVEDVVAGIEIAAAGGAILSPRIAQRLLRHVEQESGEWHQAARLSDREVTVLRLLADRADIDDAAARLGLAPGAVRRAVSDILVKLQAQSRGEVAVRAIRDRIV